MCGYVSVNILLWIELLSRKEHHHTYQRLSPSVLGIVISKKGTDMGPGQGSHHSLGSKQVHDPSAVVYSIILPPDRCTKRFLNVSDTIISLFLISPLVVAHWRGTWVFMDHHSEYFPPWHTFIFGGFLHLTLVLLRELFHDKLSLGKAGERTIKQSIIKYICTKVYLYIFSVGCIMNWRGGWAMMEMYWGMHAGWAGLPITLYDVLPDWTDFFSNIWTGFEFWSAFYTMVVCAFGLICFKSVRNVLAPPIVILTDSREFAFAFPTRFRFDVSTEFG